MAVLQARVFDPTDNGTLTFTKTVSFDSAITAGSLVVIFFLKINNAHTYTMADSASNTMTEITDVSVGSFVQMKGFYRANHPGGTTDFVISASDDWTGGTAYLVELSGMDLTAPLDDATGQVQATLGAGTDVITSGSLTTTVANDVIIGFVHRDYPAIATAGTGFTSDTDDGLLLSGAAVKGEYATVVSAGSAAATFSHAQSTDVTTIAAAFKIAADEGTDYTLTADQGTYTLTGQAANTLQGYKVIAEQGSYIITGSDALADYVIRAEYGAYVLTGQDATFTSTAPAILTAEHGVYVLSGQNNVLLRTYSMSADYGAYVLTGQAADLIAGIPLIADGGDVRGARRGRINRGFPFLGRY